MTFDPRGTGSNIPYQCPDLSLQPDYVQLQDMALPLDDPAGLNARYLEYTQQGELCGEPEYKELGELIGTAFVARDIKAIFDALDEDGYIRYWGFSYGTLLGTTLAAMFPDKIDRMVLDGNINPTDYYHGYFEESVDSNDPALQHFFDTCAEAGPENCPFAVFSESGDELQEKFYELLESSKNRTYTFVYVDGPDEPYNYNNLQGAMWHTLSAGPDVWNHTAGILADFYQNLTGYPEDISWDHFTTPPDPSDATADTTMAITCGDWDDIDGTIENWKDWLKLYEARSRLGAPPQITYVYRCSTWRVNGRGKYTGKFTNIETKTPILFVNGPYDVNTPLTSAINSSAGFVNSKVLVHGGAGHCSSREPSSCTIAAVRSYWETGVLPDVSEPCPPNNKNPWIDLAGNSRKKWRRRAPSIGTPSGPGVHVPRDVTKREDATATSEVAVPATCTPVSARDENVSTGQLQQSLDDFRELCSGVGDDKWFLKLMCGSIG